MRKLIFKTTRLVASLVHLCFLVSLSVQIMCIIFKASGVIVVDWTDIRLYIPLIMFGVSFILELLYVWFGDKK